MSALLYLVAETSTVEQKVHLDVGILTFIVAVALPLVVGIVTKSTASPRLQAMMLLSLSLVAAAIQRLIETNGVVNLKTFLANFAVTWLIAMGTYLGFLKPTGVGSKVQNVAPNFGIGKAA